jgi:flagellar biosynthesis protein FliP
LIYLPFFVADLYIRTAIAGTMLMTPPILWAYAVR